MEALEGRQLYSATGISAATAAAPLTVGTVQAKVVQPLSVVMGSNGIAKISYNGTVLFDSSTDQSGVFSVYGYTATTGGKTQSYWAPAQTHTTTWNAANQTLTVAYSWGTVAVQYTLAASRISMTIQVHNTTTDTTIGGVNIFPVALNFPKRPAGFNGGPNVAFGTTGPGVVVADFGTGTVAVVEEDANRPIYSGFMSGPTTVTDNTYVTWVGTTPLAYQPNSWPVLNEPIIPGATSTYKMSLRFGATGSTNLTLAPEVVNSFAVAKPDELQWANRNPIGMLFPAGSGPSGRSATNPRGWFNDPSINVFTPAGLAIFSQELLTYAARSVAVLQGMHAQGMITWDLEGEQFPQNTTYIGDPRLATTLAPELAYNNVVDQYFATFRNAGLAVGVTLRPSQLIIDGNGAHQQAVTDSTAEIQMLISKITYARRRWGAKLFYIDSTEWGDDPTILQTVHQQCPGVLLIPEHSTTASFASTAPFGQVRMGATQTPAAVRQVYAGAFSCIDASVGDVLAAKAALTQGVKNGDILMFSGWFNTPDNDIVKQAYQDAGKWTASPAIKVGAAGYQPVVAASAAGSAASVSSNGAGIFSSTPITDRLGAAGKAIAGLLG